MFWFTARFLSAKREIRDVTNMEQLDTDTSNRIDNDANETPSDPKKQMVIPGDQLASADDLKAGKGVYREASSLWASQVGFRSDRSQFVNVVPFNGGYRPRVQDNLICLCIGQNPSSWLMDIGASHPATMHVTESPWRVDFGDTGRFLAIGDVVYSSVLLVDEIGHLQVSMKGPGFRKLYGGTLVKVSPYTVPRIIGRNGSMVNMLKEYTQTRIIVGQNGWVWVDGKLKNMQVIKAALKLIQKQAFSSGLTNRVKLFLEESETA